MPAEFAPQLTNLAASTAYRISPKDSVALAPLRGPDACHDASVFLEIWEPGGAQPPNCHPSSVETFLVLRGTAVAHCDDEVVSLEPGSFLVLPPGSRHWIANLGAGRLYAITTMCPDKGFHRLVTAGVPEPLGADDLAVVAQAAGPGNGD